MANALKAYYNYNDLIEYLFKLYIIIVFIPIIEGHLNYSISPLK